MKTIRIRSWGPDQRTETMTTYHNRCGYKATLFFCVVLTTLLAWASNIPAVSTPDALTTLIEEAYRNNQELLGMEENVSALKAEAPFAGSLQDPIVGIGLLNLPVDSFDLDQEAMTQKQLFVAQKFPWFGTLGLKQQVIELKALEANSLLHAQRLDVGSKVAASWYELGFLSKSLEVNKSLETIITQILRVAEVQYSTGKGLQQDILTGQVQLSELIDEEVNLKSRIQVEAAKISGFLNRDSVFTEKGPAVLEEPNDFPEADLLSSIGLQYNPKIQAQKVALDRSRVEVQLAEKTYLPNMDIRLSYGQREDNPTTGADRADFFSATVAMTVPLWQSTRQDSKLAGAEKRLAGAEKTLLGLQANLPHNINMLLAEIAAARENHGLYRNALTIQAAHLADASLAAYSVGKVEFNTMLTARVRLLRIELKAEKYKYQIYKKLAELEELIGTSLSSLEGLK